MKRERSGSHVVCYDGTYGDLAYAIRCLRCGAVQRVALPIDLDCYFALGKAFAKNHRHCLPPADPSKESGSEELARPGVIRLKFLVDDKKG